MFKMHPPSRPVRSSVSMLALSLLVAAAACSSGTSDSGGSGGTGPATGGHPAGGTGAGSPGGTTSNPGAGGDVAGGTVGTGGSGVGGFVGGVGGTGASPSGGSTGTGLSGAAGATSTGGNGGALASGGSSGGQAGSSGSAGSGGPVTHQQFILYDDSGGRLLYVNNANPSANWTSNSGSGRDLQLVGGGRVALGKSDGWDEYLLSDGTKAGGQHGFAGTQTVHRMADGNTILASASGAGIVLKLVSATGQMTSQITYAGFSYVRMVRPTSTGTFMVAADTVAFEGDAQGNVLSQGTIAGGQHTWKAMRLANGNIGVTSGYGATLLIYDSTWKLLQTIGGKSAPNAAQIAPWFYADYHVMPNGDFFLVNSQADRTMDNSVQLLEYSPTGTLVWQQKQPAGVHSLEEAIILDGLDTTKLYVEPAGQLIPAAP